LLYCYYASTKDWDYDSRLAGIVALSIWIFISKFVKLMGHYIRYPADFLLLPVSIVFGYLHGLIKAKAMLSLNVVSRDAPGMMKSTFAFSGTPKVC